MEQVERLLSLDIMSRQKFGGESEKIYFSLGKFVSALRHKRCIMHRMQCRKEENYVKKDTVFLLEYERQGKGGQVIMITILAVFSMMILVGFSAKSLVISRQRVAEVHTETGISSGAVTGTSVSTGSALSLEKELEEQVQVEKPVQTPAEMVVDTSGLDAFHGFMTENAYTIMEEQIKTECQKRQCKSAKKLNYQQTAEGSFDVASFVLLSDGGIIRCDYNLKSGAVSISQTEYSEVDITAMHNAEMKAEQEAVERQQAADKKKAELAKKKSQKKASTKAKKNKDKSKKKSSSRKSATKKKAKSKVRKK